LVSIFALLIQNTGIWESFTPKSTKATNVQRALCIIYTVSDILSSDPYWPFEKMALLVQLCRGGNGDTERWKDLNIIALPVKGPDCT
jgi:hypothetical protein